MLTKKSRYKNARPFPVDDKGEPVFPGFRARDIGPAEGVIEHEVQAGDRLDLLARHYYDDDRLWWRIVDANPNILYGPNLLAEEIAGEVILIPRLKESR